MIFGKGRLKKNFKQSLVSEETFMIKKQTKLVL